MRKNLVTNCCQIYSKSFIIFSINETAFIFKELGAGIGGIFSKIISDDNHSPFEY